MTNPEIDSALSGNALLGSVFADRYELAGELSSAPQYSLYRITDRSSAETLVLRFVRPVPPLSVSTLKTYKDRLTLMKGVAHPNLVAVRDVGQSHGGLLLVMDYVPGGVLAPASTIHSRYSAAQRLLFAQQFTAALALVHSRGVVHGGIHLGNLLADAAGALRLSDIGAGPGSGRTIMPSDEDALRFLAPEVLKHRRYTAESDVFAAGVVLKDLLTEAEMPGPLPALIAMCVSPSASQRHVGASDLAKCLVNPESVAVRQPVVPPPAAESSSVYAAPPPPAPAPVKPPPTLADLLAGEPGDRERLVPFLIQVLEALDRIHSVNRFHAPLVPAILPASTDPNAIVNRLTAPAELAAGGFGAPKYSPADIFRAGDRTMEFACAKYDIYTAGFIFYELLLGREKFASQFSPSGEDEDLHWLQWHAKIETSAQPLAELLTDFPAPLSETISRMIEKRPPKRFANLSEALAALREATTPKPPPVVEEPQPAPPPAPEPPQSETASAETSPPPVNHDATVIFSPSDSAEMMGSAVFKPPPAPPKSRNVLPAIVILLVLAGVLAVGYWLMKSATAPTP